MIDVVPPQAAATVPLSKSSAVVVPPNGMSRGVCTSMPPGNTSRPAAEMTSAPSVGRATPRAASRSPLMPTSAVTVSAAPTSGPPLMTVSNVIGDRRRGVEGDLGAGEAEGQRPCREVAIVADVDADLAHPGREHRIAEIPRPEIELLPEPGPAVGQVALPVLAEVGAVGVDDGRGVVVEAGHVLLVDRNDHDHAMLAGERLHERDGGTLGNVLDHGVPPDALLGGEVRSVEQLLETHDLDVPPGRLLDHRDVLVDEPLLQVVERRRSVLAHRSLDEPSPHDARHS